MKEKMVESKSTRVLLYLFFLFFFVLIAAAVQILMNSTAV